ncbi:MAG: DUF4386 domain-containing protein [Bacteroidetes bacterium]|nr:MAG: DUF4386 domain-containing protein [Bacteroidota bacterium]
MQRRAYRLTGFFYLLVIICAGLSQGYIRGTLVVPGDAAATAAQILGHGGLFRMGITLDLVAFLLDVVISMMLYPMFRSYGKTLALISSALRLIAHPAIGSLNLLHHYMAAEVLGGAGFLTVFEPAQLEALSLLFMQAHTYGYLIAGAFFGLHCLLLGIQIFRSTEIPNLFGAFLLGSGAGYVIETFGNFSLPGYEAYTALIVGVAAAIGEVSLTFYFLIKGKRAS